MWGNFPVRLRTGLALCPVCLLSGVRSYKHELPDSSPKNPGLLEVCVWVCVMLVVKWSAHANRPIMYILSWRGAIFRLGRCISTVLF